MTYQEIYDALAETDLPVAYNFWEAGQVPSLPYIVFTYPGNDDFCADNVIYQEIAELNVELYTKRKSITTEKAVEAVLQEHFGAYGKTSSWLDTENMQMTTYQMEVLIDG